MRPSWSTRRHARRVCVGVTFRSVVASLLLGTVLAGCSKGNADASVAELSALSAGTYIVRSAARFQGDTLTLAGTLTSSHASTFATLVPPDARKPRSAYKTEGSYSGYVSAVSPRLHAPGTSGPQVQFDLECRCQSGTTALGQPRYEQLWFNGRYAVRDLGRDRVELRGADLGGVTHTDTLQRVR